MRSQHTDEEKATICAFAVEHGHAAAAEEYGVKVNTISSWMHRRGLQTNPEAQATCIRKAVVAAVGRRDERVAKLADSLLAQAESWLGKLGEADVPIVEAGEAKAIMTAAAIAIDKSQLLAGAPTSRTETGTAEEIARLRDELEERRKLHEAKPDRALRVVQ